LAVADGYLTGVQAALRTALVADAGMAALVADRIVDEPRENVIFPYIRFGGIAPVNDDTDGALGAIVTVGLETHSRPVAGKIEAARICEAINTALHRRPEVVTVAGYTVVDVEVLTWTVTRASDGATYVGTLALEVHLDA
jgi:uncharacterized protein DUF3168